MLIKQDFSNLLVKEIFGLETAISLINEEIEIREASLNSGTDLEIVHNKRAILNLKNELKSKNEFLFKLREKHLHDEPEIEDDFMAAVNGIEDVRAIITYLKDLHDQARCKYLLEEVDLWLKKTNFPEYREAVGHYFKALKMSLRDCGIDI